MSESPPRLCTTCLDFDIHSLLKDAEAQQISILPRNDHRIRRGLPQQFRQHRDLKTLKRCALSGICNLCSAIWGAYQRTRNIDELADEVLEHGVGSEQIFLGTEQWNLSRSPLPHVVAMQTTDSPLAVARQLACFEVCAAYGRLHTFMHNACSKTCTGNESSKDVHILARLQACSNDDPRCFELARSWLTACLRGHTACRTNLNTQLHRPTRLLHLCADDSESIVSDSESDPSSRALVVKLVKGADSSDQYAALSYCWVTAKSFVLNEQTKSKLEEGVNVDSIPATLRDAAIATHRLGLTYLWIDALCICQDSTKDWAREAGLMRHVYHGAAVTIEAASATSSTEGFLKTRNNSMPYCKLTWRAGNAEPYVYLRPVFDIPDSQLIGTKIYSRGWTFQERLLAPRTLSFGTQQLTFECAEGLKEEAGRGERAIIRGTEEYLSKEAIRTIRKGTGWLDVLSAFWRLLGLYPRFDLFGVSWVTEPVLAVDSDTMVPYYEFWYVIVSKYSERVFTNWADRLPALSGLAAEFHRATGDRYVAGMWMRDLVYYLGWTSKSLYRKSHRYLDSGMGLSAPSTYIDNGDLSCDWPYGVRTGLQSPTPSWSWASLRSMVDFPARLLSRSRAQIDYFAVISNVEMKPRFEDPYGLLDSAYIDLRVPMLKFTEPHTKQAADYECPLLFKRICQLTGYSEIEAPEYFQQHRPHEEQELALVKLYRQPKYANKLLPSIVMLLVETSTNGCYRRLGCTSELEIESASDFMLERRAHSTMRKDVSSAKFLEEHEQEIQDACGLTEELESPLWSVQDIRLV